MCLRDANGNANVRLNSKASKISGRAHEPQQEEDLLPGAAAAAEAHDNEERADHNEHNGDHVDVRPVRAGRRHVLIARHELQELDHRGRVHAQPDAQSHASRAHQLQT